MISAKIADRLGFATLYMTGFGVSATLGMPDAGLASYTEMVERVARSAGAPRRPSSATATPASAGCSTSSARSGATRRRARPAIQIEDQVFPKKCGHTPGRRVVPVEQMVRKIEVAVASRSSPDFLIVARTDARTNHGLDEALRRGEAYAKAGADILFIESPESEEEMARIGRHFDLPLVANMADGGRTPILPKKRLEEIGYRLAIFPVTGLLAATKALERVYGVLKEKGSSDTLGSELYPFNELLPDDRLRARVGLRQALVGGLSLDRLRLLVCRLDRVEGVGHLGAEQLDGGEDADADDERDQTVLDRRGARFIGRKALHTGSPQPNGKPPTIPKKDFALINPDLKVESIFPVLVLGGRANRPAGLRRGGKERRPSARRRPRAGGGSATFSCREPRTALRRINGNDLNRE